jgi:hypothetical protein
MNLLRAIRIGRHPPGTPAEIPLLALRLVEKGIRDLIAPPSRVRGLDEFLFLFTGK